MARSQQNKKLAVPRPGKGIEHDRKRERRNATTRHDDDCVAMITSEGPGRFHETTSMVYVYHDFARVVNTYGSKTLKTTSYPCCELAGAWQTIEQVGKFDATTTPVP